MSHRTPSPRSEDGRRTDEVKATELGADCLGNRDVYMSGFTFLKTSMTEALACPLSTCSSDRKACVVPSDLGSASSSSAGPLLTEPLAWPFGLPFSTGLLSAIEYTHTYCTYIPMFYLYLKKKLHCSTQYFIHGIWLWLEGKLCGLVRVKQTLSLSGHWIKRGPNDLMR